MTSRPPTDAGHPSENQNTQVGAPRSLWAELGLNEPEFLDESSAPEVDEALLRSLIRQELPEKVARAAYRLIYSYKSWHQAHALVLLDEFKKLRRSSDA